MIPSHSFWQQFCYKQMKCSHISSCHLTWQKTRSIGSQMITWQGSNSGFPHEHGIALILNHLVTLRQ